MSGLLKLLRFKSSRKPVSHSPAFFVSRRIGQRHFAENTRLPLAGEVGLSGTEEGIRIRILPLFEQELRHIPRG